MNMICTILNYEPTEIEVGCCGDPDRIISRGSCSLSIFDLELDFGAAARSWADAQKTSAESILMINGKILENSGTSELQLEDNALDPESWTQEEKDIGKKLQDCAAEIWTERWEIQEAARKKREAEWAAKRAIEQKAAEERIRQWKLAEYKKLKSELGL